jgi:alpha-methylacyl-CoA racemase
MSDDMAKDFYKNTDLNGVRVLDLSRLLPGPACTWYLQSMGANVDRIEPKNGDLTRYIPPFMNGVGAYYCAVGVGKRSMACDSRNINFSNMIKRMVSSYDVLVEGFRPGVLENMGLSPTELHHINPRLVIARLSGYGQNGPYENVVGHDINYIGFAGILSAQVKTDKGISLPALQIADMSGALHAALGIVGALFARERHHRGRVLDISLTESAMAMFAPMIVGILAENRNAHAGKEPLSGGLPYYNTFCCSDGLWIAVGAVEQKFQQKIKDVVGSTKYHDMKDFFIRHSQQECVDLLGDACVSPILDILELPENQQHQYRQMFEKGMVRNPLGTIQKSQIPNIGMHGAEILRECGFEDVEITKLIEDGCLRDFSGQT